MWLRHSMAGTSNIYLVGVFKLGPLSASIVSLARSHNDYPCERKKARPYYGRASLYTGLPFPGTVLIVPDGVNPTDKHIHVIGNDWFENG